MPKYRVSAVLPYTREQLFDLAADVERYPDYLPWWAAARVRKRDGNVYCTDQVIRFGPLRQRFGSRTVLRRPEAIEVASSAPPFRTFRLDWTFAPAPEGGCEVGLAADMDFRSRFVQELFGEAFVRGLGRIMRAFEARAHQQYGSPPSEETHG